MFLSHVSYLTVIGCRRWMSDSLTRSIISQKSYQTLLSNARDRYQRDFPFPACCGLEEEGWEITIMRKRAAIR
jgi:hypothetical protein